MPLLFTLNFNNTKCFLRIVVSFELTLKGYFYGELKYFIIFMS